MRVLVCGSRTFTHRKILDATLFGLAYIEGDLTVMQGGAKGADMFAREWADDFLPDGHSLTFEADWKLHGKGAGPRRNQQMLDEGQPDLVLAFVNKPLAESRGTADMVRRAQVAGVATYVIESAPSTPATSGSITITQHGSPIPTPEFGAGLAAGYAEGRRDGRRGL